MMLSICITVKNRSRFMVDEKELFLFPNCVRSIVESVPADMPCEIVISDWHSDDWPLNEWLESAAGNLPVQLIQVDGAFNRGKGRNIAADAAKGDYLFFLDADCLLCKEMVVSGVKALDEGKASFPIVYSFDSPEHTNGEWTVYGYGNCLVTRKMHETAGAWPEYSAWGKEDDDYYANVAAQAEVVREQVEGFYHQWHPNDIVWKNRYAERAKEIATEVEQVNIAKEELVSMIPANEPFILIDEARFGGSGCITNRKDFQFPEVDGDYGGLPVDSDAAIKEFKRLHREGASKLVIAWVSFWWLDFYSEFKSYIDHNYNCVFKNDRLMVYDLKQNRSDESSVLKSMPKYSKN